MYVLKSFCLINYNRSEAGESHSQ